MPRGWKLWWGQTSLDVIDVACNCEFHRIGANVTLCYAKAKQMKNMQLADDQALQRMGADDHRWLKECIDAVLARKVRKEKISIHKTDREFMMRVVDELEAEKSKLAEKEVTANGQ